jgi:hypothetical protein
VLGEAGDRERARHGAERQHEVAPLDRLRPLVRLDGGGARVEIERVTLPRISSACGHISRNGTTQWRGSSVPEAASGRSGV